MCVCTYICNYFHRSIYRWDGPNSAPFRSTLHKRVALASKAFALTKHRAVTWYYLRLSSRARISSPGNFGLTRFFLARAGGAALLPGNE